MIRRTHVSFLIAVILCVCAVSAGGQTPDPARRPPVLRSTSIVPDNPEQSTGKQTGAASLITVPAIVMDRNGRYVPNLQKEDFTIQENGVEQTLAYFMSVEKPFTVAL